MQTSNSVTLIGYYGGDKTHCLSAWQSTNIEFDFTKDINTRTQVLFAETAKTKKKSPAELLKMLASEGHHTPFEKSTLHFQLTGDIATHIHCLKHRVNSINSESARYKELQDKWHIPDDWDHLIESICSFEDLNDSRDESWIFPFETDPCCLLLPRSEGGDVITDPDCSYTWADLLERYIQLGHTLYHAAVTELTPALGRKRAKESARYFLPYAKQLDFDMMFNFRSFVQFQQLRNSDKAQKEVKDIAQLMLDQVANIPDNPFKDSLIAFNLIQ